MPDYIGPDPVLHFWFEALDASQWWAKDEALDAEIARRFGALLRQAAAGELYGWRETPQGRLAEILVLDQFSRNIHRDTPAAFARDPMALVLAQEVVLVDAQASLSTDQRAFLYLPFMHSESAAMHVWAERLYREPGLEQNYDFELQHKAIIDRFGRYPHRNAILGRESTPEELAFLQQPGSSF